MRKDQTEKLKAMVFQIATQLDVKVKEDNEIESQIYDIIDSGELWQLGFYVDLESKVVWTKEEDWVWHQANPETSMIGDNIINARKEHYVRLKSRILYHLDEDFWGSWERDAEDYIKELNLKHILKNCVIIAEEPYLYAKKFDDEIEELERFSGYYWDDGDYEKELDSIESFPLTQPIYVLVFKGSTLGAFANKETLSELTEEERLEVL